MKLQNKFAAAVLPNFEAFDNDKLWIEGHPKAKSHTDSNPVTVQARAEENVGLSRVANRSDPEEIGSLNLRCAEAPRPA